MTWTKTSYSPNSIQHSPISLINLICNNFSKLQPALTPIWTAIEAKRNWIGYRFHNQVTATAVNLRLRSIWIDWIDGHRDSCYRWEETRCSEHLLLIDSISFPHFRAKPIQKSLQPDIYSVCLKQSLSLHWIYNQVDIAHPRPYIDIYACVATAGEVRLYDN